ncbi:MAG TPA: GNAT family N-acetyltransferase [Micromonosporaceae bacterium]
MSDITVRPATPADYPAVGRLSVAAYRADGQLSVDSGYDRVLADVADRAVDGEVLVAVDGSGTVLGAVTFVLAGSRYAERARPGQAEFRMLAVDPAAQGRGAGLLLARACVARAEELGARAVVIYTRDFAAVAQRMYQRLGFVREPEHDVTPVAGVTLQAMRLDLTGSA